MSIEPYFNEAEKNEFRDAFRAIVYGSECSIVDALLFMLELSENDPGNEYGEKIVTHADVNALVRLALENAAGEIEKLR